MCESCLRGRELRLKCKREAKEKLKGNVGTFAIAFILFFILIVAVESVCTFIPLVGSIVSGAIATLFSVGYMSMSLKLLEGVKPKIADLFDGFKVNPMKTVGLFLLLMFMVLPIIVVSLFLVVVPSFVALGYSTMDNGVLIGSIMALFTSLSLLVLSMLLITFFSIIIDAYFFASYYMVLEGDSRGIFDIFKASKELIKGRVCEYVVFTFSFLGWYLTVPFTLGLSLLWITPYTSVAFANYYKAISGKDSIVLNSDSTLV